jgi:hypothetical protein
LTVPPVVVRVPSPVNLYTVSVPSVVIVGDPVVLLTTAAAVPLEKGRNDQVFVAVLMHVPPAFCASVKVAPLTVTPAPAVTVTTPAPRLMRTIFVPTANATDEFGGMVEVVALAFE